MPHYSLLAADNFSVSLCFCKAAIVNKNFQREHGYFVMAGLDYILKCTFNNINNSVKKLKLFFIFEFNRNLITDISEFLQRGKILVSKVWNVSILFIVCLYCMASEDLTYNPQMFVYKYEYTNKTTREKFTESRHEWGKVLG